jgi:chitodextrinase
MWLSQIVLFFTKYVSGDDSPRQRWHSDAELKGLLLDAKRAAGVFCRSMAWLICLCALTVVCLPVTLLAQSPGQPSKEYIYIGGRLLAIETPNDTTPPGISAVSASSISSSGATITWTTNEASDSQVDYGTTTGYGTSTTLNASMVTTHSVALSGLTSLTLYHYRVKSKDAAGNLATSEDFTFTTTNTADTTPPVITGVTASPVTSNSASITWTTDEASDSQVDYGTTVAYGSSSPINGALGTSHSQLLSGLTAATVYHYRVKSKDAAGNLATSGDFTFTTLSAGDTTPPSVPTNLMATAVSSSQINLSWTASTDNVGVTGYKIFRNGSQVNTATGTSYQDTGLTPLTTYTYTVSAYDAANNNSAQSSPASATTQDAVDITPPSVPTNLVATTLSSGQIYLSWDASTDNVRVTGYKIYRNDSQVGTTSTALTYQDTGLTPSTTYTYKVSAYDARGNNSDYSNPVQATTSVSTVHNTSLSLNGASIVNVPYNSSLNIHGMITVEAWINTSSANATQYVVDRGNSYSLRLINGRPRLYIYYSLNSSNYVQGTSTVNNGQWHHLAGVYDGTQLQIYVDGVAAAAAVVSDPPALRSNALTIGGLSTTLYTFTGLIDEVRITAAALYTDTFTPQAHLITLAGTRALWKFDDQNLNDSSGYGNHGTGQGAVNYDARVPIMSPSISDISPTLGTTDGGTAVTVNGYNFIVGAQVSFDGMLATNATVVDNTRMTANTPPHAAGTVSVVVTNDDGLIGTLPNGFTFTAPPTVTGVSPNVGPISGGTPITITGTNFQSGATVKLGGTPATNVAFVNSTSLTATTPAHAAGLVDVLVTNPNGVSKALTGGYSYNNPVPQISSLVPSSVFVSNGAFTLTVNGTNFVSGSIVRVNGSNRTTTFYSSIKVTAQILAGDIASVGTVPITVFNPPPVGGSSNSANLTVNANPVPSITTIDPTNVAAGGGPFNLTVNGNNFVTSATVWVSGNPRSTTYVNGQKLTAQIVSTDIANPGSLSITTINPAPGGGTSNAATLTVDPASNSLSLDGNQSYARAANSSSLNITGPLTVEAWVKTSSGSSADLVERMCSGTCSEGGYVLRLSSGRPQFYIYQNSSHYSYVSSSSSIADGTWHHVAGIYDGSQLWLRVDGVQKDSTTAAYALRSGTSGLEIGIAADLSTRAFNGLIDEVRVTADAVYTGPFTPQHHLTALPNTIGLWKFDGFSTLDSSTSHNNLTLYGNATFSAVTP